MTPPLTRDPFADARAVADTVLLEGYVLYPYRASAAKNRMRWQFGVLTSPAYAAASGERSTTRTECVVDPGADDEAQVVTRFLRVVRRSVEGLAGDAYHPVDRLDAPGATHVPWDEGRTEEVALHARLADLLDAPAERVVDLPAWQADEPVDGADGRPIGRLVRETSPLRLSLTVAAERLPGPYGALRLRVDVANLTATATGDVPRDEALRSSLVAAHTLLALSEGSFLSLAGPPEWAVPAAASCVNDGTWPVLVGGSKGADRSRVVLSSPIILDDNPTIAPESATVLYDSTEIDEILTLRTLTLTDDEKREARGTDPRAAAVVDAVDGLPPELYDRLHGAIRSMRAVPVLREPPAAAAPPLQPWWDPGADDTVDPERDSVEVGGVAVAKGARVVLRPRARAADAQDMFLDGRTATVQAVLRDVDGETHVAVSIDDDLLAEVQAAHGRYRYFKPDEVEPLEPAP